MYIFIPTTIGMKQSGALPILVLIGPLIEKHLV